MSAAASDGGENIEQQNSLQPPRIPFQLNVPPVECCICYGSNFFPQWKQEGGPTGAPQGASQGAPQGVTKGAHGEAPLGMTGSRSQQEHPDVPGASSIPTSSSKPPMGDLLLLVPQQQLLQWHEANLKENMHHYSSLFGCLSSFGGPQTAAKGVLLLTRASGVHVLFNCRVPTGLDCPKVRRVHACSVTVATSLY